MKKNITLVLVWAALLTAPGCSWISRHNPFSSSPDSATASAENPETNPQSKEDARAALSASPGGKMGANLSAVEIMWQVPPGDSVERYHLYYGSTPTTLSEHVTIPVSSLEKIDHASYGPVFRYYLRGVPRDQELYVSIRAENKQGVSTPSETIRVSAEENSKS